MNLITNIGSKIRREMSEYLSFTVNLITSSPLHHAPDDLNEIIELYFMGSILSIFTS